MLKLVPMVLDSEESKVKQLIERFFGDTGIPRGDLLKRLGDLTLMICGGAINSILTNRPVSDLDFYLVDKTKQEEADVFLRDIFKEVPYVSPNAITYKRRSAKSRKVWTIQLITRFSGTPQEIFDNFDFTITHGAYCFKDAHFSFGQRFFQDLASRKLVYAGNSHYPICALYRTKKYSARGYNVPGSTLMHIALSIVQLKIENYRQLKEQLMGIDTMFLQGLIEKNPGRYGDSLPVDYGLFVADIFAAIDGLDYEEDESTVELVEE